MPTCWITELDPGDIFRIPAHAICDTRGEWAMFLSITRLRPDDEYLTFVCSPIGTGEITPIPGRIHDSSLTVTYVDAGHRCSFHSVQ